MGRLPAVIYTHFPTGKAIGIVADRLSHPENIYILFAMTSHPENIYIVFAMTTFETSFDDFVIPLQICCPRFSETALKFRRKVVVDLYVADFFFCN